MQEGIQLNLHIFQQERSEKLFIDHSEVKINFYQPKKGHRGFSFMAPFSISSYYNKKLISTLSRDKHPILFHGLETTFNVKEIDRSGRKIFIRCLEHETLGDYANNNFKIINGNRKWHDFFSITRVNYENDIKDQFPFFLSYDETAEKLTAKNKKSSNYVIPPFIGIPTYLGEQGAGNFCLFHGDLDNHITEKAAHWLLDNVFNEIDVPLVITGNNPSKWLEYAAHRQLNTCLVSNPTSNERMELIRKAQVNILPYVNSNAYTHEMIQSLIFGRHILALEMTDTTDGLNNLIHSENSKEKFKTKATSLFELTFTEDEKNKREAFLQKKFSDKAGAEKLISKLY